MDKDKLKKISLITLLAIVIIIILCLVSCQHRKTAKSEGNTNGTLHNESNVSISSTLTIATSKEEAEAIKLEEVAKEESKEEESEAESSNEVESSDSNKTYDETSPESSPETTRPESSGESSKGTAPAQTSTAQTTPVTPTPVTPSGSTENSTPAKEESSRPSTQTGTTPSGSNSSAPEQSSNPGNSSSTQTPVTPPSTESSATACMHDYDSRIVTIHHDPIYEEQPIYGTKQGIIEDAWDEVVGYKYGYITSDGVVFFIDDYGSVSSCEDALGHYAIEHNVSWKTYDLPIYSHHDAVYGDVPDYDNVVGYTKVEIEPAWNEETYQYYCTKCGAILN